MSRHDPVTQTRLGALTSAKRQMEREYQVLMRFADEALREGKTELSAALFGATDNLTLVVQKLALAHRLLGGGK